MTSPGPTYSHERKTPAARIERALEGVSGVPFWLDTPDRPAPEPPLSGNVATDLLVVGGGYSGLWTALIAKERDPQRDVVLIEGREAGWAASGRNGGFLEASLTHGEENGARHFPDELSTLHRLADENFAELAATLERYGIDAEYEPTGMLTVATESHQVAALRETEGDAQFLDEQAVRALVHSPVYLAGQRTFVGTALVHPAKLVWGLKRVCLDLGVRIFEHSPAKTLRRTGDTVTVGTPGGSIAAARVALATNAFPSLLKRTEWLTLPVYDYALVTEPLSGDQLASIGWVDRFGIADSGREFHYSRRTADDRILFGGFDAIYHRGGRIRPEYDQRRATFELLADHFFTTYPQLDVRFTHAWGGVIDMCSRLSAFQGIALGGRVAYSAGFTGLGVGATRFGAKVMLDLLGGEPTELTRLKMVRSKPIPIPPEPIAYPAISIIRRAVAKSDANGGRDGLLLTVMDRFGIGFDT